MKPEEKKAKEIEDKIWESWKGFVYNDDVKINFLTGIKETIAQGLREWEKQVFARLEALIQKHKRVAFFLTEVDKIGLCCKETTFNAVTLQEAVEKAEKTNDNA